MGVASQILPLTVQGVDSVGHTPADEDVRLKIGGAFDVVAEKYKPIKMNIKYQLT